MIKGLNKEGTYKYLGVNEGNRIRHSKRKENLEGVHQESTSNNEN